MTTTEIHTESGTRYSIRTTEDGHEVRRISDGDRLGSLRRDRDWLKIYHFEQPEVGKRMVFLLEGLGELPFTERTTTPVVLIEEKDA